MEENMKRIIIFLFIILTVPAIQSASATSHKNIEVVASSDESIISKARYDVRNRLDTSQISDVLTGVKIFKEAIGKLSPNGKRRLDATLLRKAEHSYDNGELKNDLETYDTLFAKAL
jgi:hypothetical protein